LSESKEKAGRFLYIHKHTHWLACLGVELNTADHRGPQRLERAEHLMKGHMMGRATPDSRRAGLARRLLTMTVLSTMFVLGLVATGGAAQAATTPDAPTAPSAFSIGGNAADTSWGSPASDGGSPITTYIVTASPGGLVASVDAAALQFGNEYLFHGLTDGTSYTFTVAARNAIGDGPP